MHANILWTPGVIVMTASMLGSMQLWCVSTSCESLAEYHNTAAIVSLSVGISTKLLSMLIPLHSDKLLLMLPFPHGMTSALSKGYSPMLQTLHSF